MHAETPSAERGQPHRAWIVRERSGRYGATSDQLVTQLSLTEPMLLKSSSVSNWTDRLALRYKVIVCPARSPDVSTFGHHVAKASDDLRGRTGGGVLEMGCGRLRLLSGGAS